MQRLLEKELEDESNFNALIYAFKAGEISVLPFLHTHILIADAFSHRAVNLIQIMRQVNDGSALGVLVSSMEMLNGVAQNISSESALLGKKFWPGPLTMILQTNEMLNWDLGDGGAGEFVVRIPESELLRKVISKVGPVVFANANLIGAGPIKDLNNLAFDSKDLAYIVQGENLLDQEIKSTLIKENRGVAQNIEIVRVGKIPEIEIENFLSTLDSTDPT